MKMTITGTVLLMAVLIAGPIAAQQTAGPRIEIKEMRHDFGTVVQGTAASHVFEVRNIGNEPLIIEKVQSS